MNTGSVPMLPWVPINGSTFTGTISETENTRPAIERLKKEGYRIVATTPHKKDCTLDEFDLHKGKFALLFGSELKGLSPLAMQLADEFIRIPMAGFTESLNISVTAAIFIHQLTGRLRTDQYHSLATVRRRKTSDQTCLVKKHNQKIRY